MSAKRPRAMGSRLSSTARSRGALRSVQTRLVVSYVALLAISGVASMVALREVMITRLEDRVREAQLGQEMDEMRRLLDMGRNPQTGEPFGSDLRSAFDIFLSRNVPSDDEALVTFLEGQRYRADLTRFPLERLPADEMARWAAASEAVPQGADRVSGAFVAEIGVAYYEFMPISAGDASGAFVVAVLPEAELAEIGELQRQGAGVAVIVIFLAAAIGGFAARRVLRPVRLLTEAARSISQTDLTRRIPSGGDDEAAEMVSSFNAMLDRLEAVFERQREFLQDVGHELRVPLTIAVGQLGVLSDDPTDARHTIELVIDELERASRIVDDLRVLAESEDPRFVEPGRVELGPLTSELMAKASVLTSRSWQLDTTTETTIVADRSRLTQAVMNLVQNAVQNTDPGDVVALGTAIVDDEVRIWVRDSGPGIPPDDQQRILERFQRGRGARERYRGAGLGLSIVQAIAVAHHGQVEIDSRPGSGTRVTIVLPRRVHLQEPLVGPSLESA